MALASAAIGLFSGLLWWDQGTAERWHHEAREVVSGRPGFRTTDDGTPHRWHEGEVVVALDNSLGKLHDRDAELAIQMAFGAWLSTEARLPDLRFTEANGANGGLKPDGVNSVLYAPISMPGHENDLAITVGFSDPESGRIIEADIILNRRHRFFVDERFESEEPASSCDGSIPSHGCGRRYDLQNVMTHEVGHFYGLGEDHDDPSSTMFSCTSACEIHKRSLTASDVDAVETLYAGGGEVSAPICSVSQVRGNTSVSWLVAGFVPLLGLALRRRQRTAPGTRGARPTA